MPSEELRQAAEEILAYPGTFAEESACLKHGPALARAAIAMLAATASPSLEACVANLEAVGSEWRAIEIVKRHWPIAPVPASLGACVAEIRNSPHKVGPLTLIDRCVEIVSRRWPTAPAVEPSEPTDHTLTMSRDDKPEPSETVVWADDATPFTGPQVLDLLRENERLRTELEAYNKRAERL